MLRRRTDQTWTSFDQFKKDSDNFIWMEQVDLEDDDDVMFACSCNVGLKVRFWHLF